MEFFVVVWWSGAAGFITGVDYPIDGGFINLHG
jgi:hypothetical protein